MNDMSAVITPKSDQMNADDLIAGPITIKISAVTIRPGTEQPISVHYEGDNGKPYKACKSMCRVMVTAWGADSKKYAGRSMTLYRDASVKWGGMEVGGIRISHMSDIDSAMTMALTMTRANKKPYTVRPIVKAAYVPATDKGPANDAPDESVGQIDPLVVKAAEWASCGEEKYKAFWLSLSNDQKAQIGPERHERNKAAAKQVAV